MAENEQDPALTCPPLPLERILGYNGKVKNGLHVVEGEKCPSILFPLGSACIKESLNASDNKQRFFRGHSNPVSAVAVSPCGKYLASGQVTHMGYKAAIHVYTLSDHELYATFTLHKVKIESLAFSCDSKLLYSLGGQDDGSVVVWDIETRQSICGNPVAPQTAGAVIVLEASNRDPCSFITAGEKSIRVWRVDLKNRKLLPEDCNLGTLKRNVQSVTIDPEDKFFYCGTTTGDILKINFETKLLVVYGPKKNRFSLGVETVREMKGKLLVGSGKGEMAIMDSTSLEKRKLASCELHGSIGSISIRGNGHQIYCGTSENNVYRINIDNLADISPDLLKTCHGSAVNDIVFPRSTSALFATGGKGDVRIWQTDSGKELRRIEVPNITCNAVAFSPDGMSIVTAWNDGKLRAYLPESGRLIYDVPHAHHLDATAVVITDCNRKIISGGAEGQIRVWSINFSNKNKPTVSLLETMKEHKCKITAIKIRKNMQQCATASEDGTCIIWDLERFTRNQMVMANSLFQCLVWNLEENQIVTSGTDRKICYWEALDGSLIRQMDGSMSGSVNGMVRSEDGQKFFTGGDDKLVKVWDYDGGVVTSVGSGHSDQILKLALSPDNQSLVSVSRDGAIAIWKI